MIAFSVLAMTAAQEAHGSSTEHETLALWQDPSLWVGAAFVLVVLMFWRMGVHKTVGAALDKRAQKIADELDQARKLREEAQELLAQYQRRQREAEEEAKGIIEQAKRDAKRLEAEARAKIDEQIARRAKSAEERIARAEAQAIAEVRGQTADLAVDAAREIIRDRMDQGAQSALVDKAISGLRAKKIH